MSERIGLMDIPFTKEEWEHWTDAFTAMSREQRGLDPKSSSEKAALLRVVIEEAAALAYELGSTGVPDIDQCRAEFIAYCCSIFDAFWDDLKDAAWWAGEQDGEPTALVWEWNRSGPATRFRFLKRVGCDAADIDVEAKIGTPAEARATDISPEHNPKPRSRR